MVTVKGDIKTWKKYLLEKNSDKESCIDMCNQIIDEINSIKEAINEDTYNISKLEKLNEDLINIRGYARSAGLL